MFGITFFDALIHGTAISIQQIIIFGKRTYIRKKNAYGVFMKKYALLRYCLVFLAIVLPYFSAAAINGPEMVLVRESAGYGRISPGHCFFARFPGNEKETIKAQTVITRSNIQRWLGEGKNLAEILMGKRKYRGVLEIFFCRKKADL